MGIVQLLQAIRNLTKIGSIKSIEQAYKLARREVGERFNQVKKQIDDAFNQGKEQKKLDDRTKDLKKTDEQGIKNLESDMKSIEQSTEKLKKISEKNKADPDEIFSLKSDPVKTSTPLQKKLTKAVEEVKQQIKEIGSLSDADMQKEQIRNALKLLRDKRMYEMGSGLEGDVRTAVREFVKKELKEGRLDIPDSYEKKMILEDRQGGVDPIDVFRKAYGEDALIAVDDIFEQYGNRLTGPTYRDIEENFRKLFKMNRGFYDMADLPVPKKEYGFEEGVRSIDSVEQDLIDQYKQLDELDNFEIPKDRKPNSMGGINRVRYAQGKLKLIQFLAGKGKNLMDQIKESIDNLFLSGDPKYDADVVVDDVLEQFGVDREMFDQKDIIDTYGKAYDMIVKGVRETDEVRKMAPKMVERLEIKAKYPGIDDDLVDKILIDDNPQRKAELLATLDEAFRMLEKGKGADEIIDTFKNQTRTKQAMGTGPEGLSQITDLYEKIKINNVQKQKDKEDNKQMRFRKLLASNKFPELNTFLEAELNEDDEKVELDVRTNLAVGGSPFTPEQLAQKKQQSYVDYLARQGVGQSGTTTGPAPTFNPFTGTTTPDTSTTTTGTGTSGTSGGTGGTSGGGTTSSGGGFSGGSSGSGSSSGGSTGSSGGEMSGGSSNVYTGAGNFPPGMGTNTGGGSTGSSGGSSGGGSGLTPNTGASNVGGGGFGGTGSIVGGGTGSTGTTGSTEYFDKDGNPASQFSKTNYENYLEQHRIMNHKGDPLSYSDFEYSYGRFMKPSDTGDLGSEAANDAANQAATALPNPYEMSTKDLRAAAQPFIDQAKAEWLAANPGATEQDFARSGGRWIDLAEDIVRRNYNEQQNQSATTANDGSVDSLTDEQAAANREGARGDLSDSTTATDPGYTDPNQYNRQADLTSPRSDGKYADEVNARNPQPIDIGGGLKEFAGKIYNAAGQVVDTAGRIVDSRPGQLALTIAKYKSGVPILETMQKVKTAVDTVNKGKDIINQVKDVYNQSIDDGLNEVSGITGNIDLREENKTGGRVKLKYGSDRYGQSKKVKSSMNVDYNDPFKKLMSNDSGRFIKSTSSLTRYAKNLDKLKNSKQAKAALRKSLLVQNEKTRKDALKKLALLKKLYSGGKSV